MQKQSDRLVVETAQGKFSGLIQEGVAVFRGIPYARPPVGALRFAPPQPPLAHQGVKPCDVFGACAVQEPGILVNTPPAEDCLYLNIWTPAIREEARLPVFFWIHGGGFFNGCGTMDYYDGSRFAQNGVIVVTINYRLGALGFLALETLQKQYGTTGNWGTLDQLAALTWTKESIAAFGGDPDCITIAGESAGSFSVSNLVMSPRAKGLFHRAVMQSGCLLSNRAAVPFTKSQLEPSIEMSRRYAALFGAEDSEDGLALLRRADPKALWEKGWFSSDVTEACPYAFWPVLDGAVLPYDPQDALLHGEWNQADFLIGYTRDEGAVFLSERTTPEGVETYLQHLFGSHLPQVMEYYRGSGKLEMLADIVTYVYFKIGMTELKNRLSAGGQTVYGYQFEFTPDGSYPLKQLGAHHAVDILYTFGTIGRSGLLHGEGDHIVEEQMHRMWCNFVACGNPNRGLPLPERTYWQRYTQEDPKIFYFGREMRCEPAMDQEKIEFLARLLVR